MTPAKRGPGRPPKPTNPSASAAAALGAELRQLRKERGLTLVKLGEQTGYSQQHLGAIERGDVVPSENVISACDAVLLANGRLISLLTAAIREQAHIRHQHEAARRTPRHTDSASAVAEFLPDDDLDWERLAAVSRRPSQVNAHVIEDLELITDRQRALYHELPSADMLVHVQAHLGLLTALLEGLQAERLRHRLASAAAEAAGFAAWLWFDRGDAFTMSQCYRQASNAVAEATDTGLRSYIKGYQGIVAMQREGPKAALTHLQNARETAPRSLSDVTRSWLTVLHADAFAHVGERLEALAALGQARDLLASARDDEQDPWMYDFDRGALALHAGNCHLTLDQPQQAAEAFTEALDALPPSCERRGAEIQVGLAQALLASGEIEEAQRLSLDSLAVFAARGSAAGLRRVRDLRNTFSSAGYPSAASALDEYARALRRTAR